MVRLQVNLQSEIVNPQSLDARLGFSNYTRCAVACDRQMTRSAEHRMYPAMLLYNLTTSCPVLRHGSITLVTAAAASFEP